MASWFNRDIATAIGLLVLSGFAWLQMVALPARSSMFPRLTIGLLALLSAAYLVGSILQRSRQEQAEPFFHHPRRFAVAFVLVAIYVVVFPWIGYFTATLLFIPVFVFATGMRHIPSIVLTRILFVATTNVLFVSFSAVACGTTSFSAFSAFSAF